MRRVRVLEQLALWNGLIGLLDGNATAAVHHLREAVGLMTYWDRRLLLPRAGVYLAEAEWRVGDEPAAERAANLALKAARMTGSRYGLLQALREFPDVLTRQIDSTLDPDSPWHELGRSMLGDPQTPAVSEPTVVRVAEFGSPSVRVNGRRYELPLAKSVELLVYLASHGGVAERDEIIAELFDSKSSKSAQAYLRAAVGKIRAVPGLGESLRAEDASVAWCGGRLSTDMKHVEETLAQLGRRSGQAKYDQAVALRDELPVGEYLPGARSVWANRRRDIWERLVVEVHQATAEAAYECSDYLACFRIATEVLHRDPFRERAWRLKMRAAAALGDGDQVIAIFRDCERALADVPTKPADSTRRLLEQLRL
jgi:DNA-binding SARP family transcriptional activator